MARSGRRGSWEPVDLTNHLDVPWDDLDPGILPVVTALVDEGFHTLASCQGHGEGDAWVTISAPDLKTEPDLLARLIVVLREHGWDGHCIIEGSMALVRHGTTPRWIKLRWWGAVPFR